MFLVNSRQSLLTAAPSRLMSKSLDAIGAPLLPKLRGYFAEFLSQCSLKRLRVFLPPTCVGLRYGRVCNSLRGFSWQHGINQFAAFRPPHRLSELAVFRICLKDPPTGLDRHFQSPDGLPFCVTPSLGRCTRGTGMLTCFPSPTPFGLGLGSDSPWED